MPHLVIYYTSQLDQDVDMKALCRTLATAMLTVQDESGKPVFPTGGTRVLAYPAPHYAIADGGDAGIAAGGDGDYAFVYLNLRMGKGRSESTLKRAGETLLAQVNTFFAPRLDNKHMGVTLQIDVGHEVFDAKLSSIHPLFNKG
jgi:5-carboxymethyl-2-hydroxymuconate isomerase